MSSNLRVNNILPTVGTNVAIGTAGGSITLTGGVTGSNLTLTGGINATGVLTATTFSGNLTGNVTGNVTGAVNSSGIATFSNGIVVAAGSVSAPSISPSGDSNTGIFFPAADTVAFAEGGAEALRITSSGTVGVNTTAVDSQLEVHSAASKINTVTIKTSAGASGYAGLAFMAGQTSAGREKAAIYFQETNGGAHYTGDIVFALNSNSGSAVQVSTSDERVRITSSGNVGIGTDNPFSATGYKSITLAGSTGGAIAFREGATTRWEIYGDNSNGIRFYDRTNTAERARITSTGNVQIANGNLVFSTAGTGIDFSADSNAAGMTSELLDDYEEGLYTPSFNFSGGGTPTYNYQYASYVKIGNLVHVNGYLSCSNVSGTSGTVRLAGFPYATKNGSFLYHAPAFGWYVGLTGIAAYGLGLDMGPNSTTHTILYGAGTQIASLNASNITNSFAIEWNFTYYTN